MRVLVNIFHPNLPESRIGGAWARVAAAAGYEVRDLYRLYPDFRIDVEREQTLAEGADRIVFQHPLHWYAPPALLKKWMEDVLQYGWAYGGPDRLAGKEWQCAVTVGAQSNEYGPDGSRGHTMEEFLRPIERTAHFCQMVWLNPFLLYGTSGLTEEELDRSCQAYVAALGA